MTSLSNENLSRIKSDVLQAVRDKLINDYKVKDDFSLRTAVTSDYSENNNHVIDIRVQLLPDAIDVIEGKDEQRIAKKGKKDKTPANTD